MNIFRRFPFLVVLALIFIPVSLLVATTAADRLGYCVNDVLPGEPGLNTGAYVQNVSSNEATVLWRTAAAREGVLELTDPSGETERFQLESAKIQRVELTDLEPGATYTWKVESGTETHEGAFTTAPEADGAVRFAAIGDSGTGSLAQYEIAAQLVANDPDAVLHTGDVVYRRGALCHYGPRYFAPYADLIATTPVFPVLGNHDVMAHNGRAWFETFAIPENGAEGYYSFDYGPVHVVALNTELYDGGSGAEIAAQKAWLEADLAATDRLWTVVVLHKPPYSSTDGKESTTVRDDLAPVFAEYAVDLVLAGHAHNYERIVPIDGVTYIVTGGGGADLYDIEAGELTAVAEKRHHLVLLDITPERMAISAIDRDGEVFDSVEFTK
ncbi:MAG: metallophosphoesterase family protein [Thermomicrobiales bacterium]|nr:metallophosphoesterase family protein [Thermomicrobiales bacterium]